MTHSRTPLVKALQAAFRKSLAGDDESVNTPQEAEPSRPSPYDRRRFIIDTFKTGALIGTIGSLSHLQAVANPWQTQPVIAIVGAGLAGLNAAYRLKKAGLSATVYEASDSLGGRITTARNLLGEGLTTEAGGEFIDSSHLDLLALMKEFGLSRYDTLAPSETKLTQDDYFIKGRRYSEREVIGEFRHIARSIQRDNASLPEDSYGASRKARELDRQSIEEYLSGLGARGWFFDLLDVAFTSEFGLDIGQQSSLNFITMIGTDTSRGEFEIFGDSDERYKVNGGNDTIIRELARRLEGQIQTGHALQAVSKEGSGYTLNFSSQRDVKADYVIIAIPFSTLRRVDIRVALPPRKRLAIDQLGYGTNSKLVMGFNQRQWRTQGFSGYLFNEIVQNGWDNSQMQQANKGTGGYTVFLGGDAGNSLTNDKEATYLSTLDEAYKGSAKQFNNRSKVFHWPSNPYALGSYSCYKVGQWTTISGVEGEAVGNLFFAGEHCSGDFQGYMNGAAETGRQTAQAIIRKVILPARRRVRSRPSR